MVFAVYFRAGYADESQWRYKLATVSMEQRVIWISGLARSASQSLALNDREDPAPIECPQTSAYKLRRKLSMSCWFELLSALKLLITAFASELHEVL